MGCRRGFVSIFVALGCTGPAPTIDAGADAGRADAAAPDAALVSTPAPPEPVTLTPCPTGWREVGSDPVRCDPWPETGRAACGAGETHFPGGAGCEPVTLPCPADGVPVGVPADAIHVRAGASGGDGSAGAPFGTIREAIAVASEGNTVAVAAGVYPEWVIVDVPITLVGACEETIIEPRPPLPALSVETVGVTLRDLRLRAGPLWVEGEALVERLIVERARDFAVIVTGFAEARIRDLLVREAYLAVSVRQDGRVDLERAVIEDADGAFINDGTVTARDLAVTGTTVDFGANVLCGEMAVSFDMERAVFESVPLTPIVVDGGRFRALDSVIRGGPSAAGADTEIGFLVGSGATLELERVTLARFGATGIAAGSPGTRVAATDVLVHDAASPVAHGVEVAVGAAAVLTRLQIDAAGQYGMLLHGAGTTVTATDVVVRASQPDAMGQLGRGIGVQEGATLTGERFEISDHHEIGLIAASLGTRVELTDVSVLDTRARACAETTCADSPGGIGAGAYLDASMRLSRFVVTRSALCGVQVGRDGILELMDGEVSDQPIGACVQVPGYDVGRITDRVLYRGNESAIESTDFGVPLVTAPSSP